MKRGIPDQTLSAVEFEERIKVSKMMFSQLNDNHRINEIETANSQKEFHRLFSSSDRNETWNLKSPELLTPPLFNESSGSGELFLNSFKSVPMSQDKSVDYLPDIVNLPAKYVQPLAKELGIDYKLLEFTIEDTLRSSSSSCSANTSSTEFATDVRPHSEAIIICPTSFTLDISEVDPILTSKQPKINESDEEWFRRFGNRCVGNASPDLFYDCE